MPRSDEDESLADADMRLFDSGNFADATIVCGDRTWSVHKAILASRCKWFKAAFYGNMAEAASGTIVLEEQDPCFVDDMLRFLYAKSVDICVLREGKDIPLLCVELFRVADFFQINELAKTAKEELQEYLTQRMRTQDKDKTAMPETLTEVLDSIKRAYKDNSTQSLRQMLLAFICMRKDTYLQATQTIDLVDELPEMGKDLLKTCLSINTTTNERNKLELPRDLPVLEAVRKGCESYVAGGPNRNRSRNRGRQPKHFNTPCVLRYRSRPDPSMSWFEVVDPMTTQEIDGMACVAPLPVIVSKIVSHEKSSIVKVIVGRFSEPDINYVRFLCPADAKHYICHYLNSNTAITQLTMDVAVLEQELRRAHDAVLNTMKLGFIVEEDEEI